MFRQPEWKPSSVIITLMMTSAQVVETSVNTNSSLSQDYTAKQDDHSNHNIDSPGFKPFTVIYNFRIVYQKNHYFFSQPKKIPLSFFTNQRNPGIFHRPKKITLGQNFRPKKITWTPLSLKYVSGAPGISGFYLKSCSWFLGSQALFAVTHMSGFFIFISILWEGGCVYSRLVLLNFFGH